jgi:DNA-cytosine methyltransferase
MNVLSLFDGISCSRVALENLGFPVKNYFSSEIDATCIKISKKNYPDIKFLGDVKDIDAKKLPKIDLLIGGSPCQDLSNAFKGDGIRGSRSSLFFEYVKLLDILKPKIFILENVKNKYQHIMDKEIGVTGREINSMHFSAQSRPRCYWTNINFPDPEIVCEDTISDILEKGVDQYFYFKKNGIEEFITSLKVKKNKKTSIDRIGLIPRDIIKDHERQRRVYSIYGKAPTLLARSDTPKILYRNKIRKLTPLETERLQGLPDNFTHGVSNTQRYKMIGNGFTVNVIEYILSHSKKIIPKQKRLL